jgi:hypothetical protein
MHRLPHSLGSHGCRLFTALWLFIIFVSVVDGYLVLQCRHQMLLTELNPVGRALLVANGGRVWALLAAKFGGTILACGLLQFAYWRNPAIGLIVAVAMAVFQLGLLIFLYFA